MQIKIKYFAQLRDKSGITEESLTLEPMDSARTIYNRLAKKYAFSLAFDDVRVAINDRFVAPETAPCAGDRLVFIPPVSGG